MRRKNQRQNKANSSIEDVNDSLHQDSLIEDGSISDSNEDEEGNITAVIFYDGAF